MSFVEDLVHSEENMRMSESEMIEFKASAESNIKRIHQTWQNNERYGNGWNFPREYSGYYGKFQTTGLGAAGWMYDPPDDRKPGNDGALCRTVSFEPETYNGCKVLRSIYRGGVFPFQTQVSAENYRRRIDEILKNMGFVRRTTRVEKVYFCFKQSKKFLGILRETKSYEKEPAYIVFVQVAW